LRQYFVDVKDDQMLEYLDSPLSTHGGENLMAETISRKEAIAWLAGILDGEGCIIAYWQKPNKDMAGPGVRVNVRFSGTHPTLIFKITHVLRSEGFKFCVAPHTRKGGFKSNAEVVVSGKVSVSRLLNLLSTHLTEKREQSELMLDLINYRNSLAKTGQQKGMVGSKPLGLFNDPIMRGKVDAISRAKKDHASVLEFSRRAGEEFGSQSSETLRRLLRFDEVMIKSDLHGDMQTAPEMCAAHQFFGGVTN